jgi:hypothetical protein
MVKDRKKDLTNSILKIQKSHAIKAWLFKKHITILTYSLINFKVFELLLASDTFTK